MSKWTSDSKQRRSKRFLAILHGLETGEPVAHLTQLVSLPAFSIRHTNDSGLDRITRHRQHSADFRAGKT